MNIFIASTSIHKIAAAEGAARDVFPDSTIEVYGRKAVSGINEQPVGHSETIQGALNRLQHLKDTIGGIRFDLLVAMENGIFSVEIEGRKAWFDLGWVIVEDTHGNRRLSHSTGIESSAAAVEEARQIGFETTTVGSVVANTTGIDATDPNIYLTAGKVSRSAMLQQACTIAMAQLLQGGFECGQMKQ